MINHIPVLHLSGKLKESLSVMRPTTCYKSVWLFFASKLWKIWRLYIMLHRNIWKCSSAKQCSFSNRQWRNLQNVQQLATWHSLPGKWSPCNFLWFPQTFPANVRTVPIRHLIKCIGTQHCYVNKFMSPITFNTRMSFVELHTYIKVNELNWHFVTNVLSTVCFNRTGFWNTWHL